MVKRNGLCVLSELGPQSQRLERRTAAHAGGQGRAVGELALVWRDVRTTHTLSVSVSLM